MQRSLLVTGAAMVFVFALGSSACPGRDTGSEIARWSADDLHGLLSPLALTLDRAVSADGQGSLRAILKAPASLPLYRVELGDVDDALLVARGRLRSRGLQGRAYLELICQFPDGSEFFSKALADALEGDRDWALQQAPFVLQAGQRPRAVELRLTVEGAGVVWVDDLSLRREARP